MFINYSPRSLIHDDKFARRKEVEKALKSYLYPIISKNCRHFGTLQAAEINLSFDRFDDEQMDHVNRFLGKLASLPNLKLLIWRCFVFALIPSRLLELVVFFKKSSLHARSE